MASTLSLSTNSSSLSTLAVPPPSQDSLQALVPNVFVIPPEEEQDENPPWCYFDATKAFKEGLSTSPDFETLAVALDLTQQIDNRAPAFHRAFRNDSQETVVMPRKSAVSWLHSIGEDAAGHRGLSEDIVEVIKVRRNEGLVDMGEASTGMKKSKTFRARASQAFKSIRNVRKNTRRPSTMESTADTWAAEESPRESEDSMERRSIPRPSTPNLARRKSAVFTQFFTFSQNSRPSTDLPESPTSPTSLASSTFMDMSHRPSISSSLSSSSTSYPSRLRPSPSLEDCMDAPSHGQSGRASPQPSLSKKQTFRRRLSVLELQRLFHSSSPAPESPSEPLSTKARRSKSIELLAEMFSPSSSRAHSLDSRDMVYSSSSSSGASGFTDDAAPFEEQDAELEMRLDSLHFDSLHFDPEEF